MNLETKLMPEQKINIQQGLAILDQTLAAAPVPRQQHDNCRGIMGEIGKIIDEWAVFKAQAAEAERDAPATEEPAEVSTQT
jgi:hypothetical protein